VIEIGLNWFHVEGWLGLTSAWSVEGNISFMYYCNWLRLNCPQVILQLHIYALYDGSRRIAIFIGVAFLIQIVALVSMRLVGTLRIKG
jgi:hypothetical protein